jgi:hypothetical protein
LIKIDRYYRLHPHPYLYLQKYYNLIKIGRYYRLHPPSIPQPLNILQNPTIGHVQVKFLNQYLVKRREKKQRAFRFKKKEWKVLLRFYKWRFHWLIFSLSGPSWSYGSWICNYLCNQYLSPLTEFDQVRCTQYNKKVGDFLWVLWFPPIKLTATILLKYSFESSVKHK